MDQPATKPATNENATFRLVCFTNYYMERDFSQSKVTYIAYANETCPTTGRPHMQGFAYNAKAQRASWWNNFLNPKEWKDQPERFVKWTKCNGNLHQNESYCTKQGKLIEFGQKPMGDGKRRDLADFCERIIAREPIKTIALDNPTVYVQYHGGLTKLAAFTSEPYEHDTVRGYWIWGVPGAGKTHYAKHRFPDAYIKAQNKWFDGYAGEESIRLDDYDCGKSLGHYLKIWMDKWACTGEIKGGTVHLRHHHFIITSNYSIEDMFKDDPAMVAAITRRCEIIYMGVPYSGN